jgi:hypothetical protein
MFMLTIVPFMYCDAPSAVVSIRKAVDATHAGAGHVTLADGASFEVTKPDGDTFVVRLRRSDRVMMCYAPPQTFAGAGPGARMAIAGIVRTGDYLYALAYPAKRIAKPAIP